MMWSKNFFLLLLLIAPSALLLGGPALVKAQDDDEDIVEDVVDEVDDSSEEEDETEDVVEEVEEAEEEIEMGSHQDAETVVVWPTFTPEAGVPAGQEASCLIGFSNIGDTPFTVTKVEGSLRYPQDTTQVIQNFTSSSVNSIVEANQQGSFMYKFTPSAKFEEERTLWFTIVVHYADGSDGTFMTAAYNETIKITEPESTFNYVSAATYVVALAGAYAAFQYAKGEVAKDQPRRKVERGTEKVVDEDWLANTFANTPTKTPRKQK